MIPSIIPSKLQYYLIIIHVKWQVVYLRRILSRLGAMLGQYSKKALRERLRGEQGYFPKQEKKGIGSQCYGNGNISPLERLMFCAFDDLILKIFANVYKIITVAGNPHDEVPVFFRVLLGLPEGVCVDHIKLNMVAIEPEV